MQVLPLLSIGEIISNPVGSSVVKSNILYPIVCDQLFKGFRKINKNDCSMFLFIDGTEKIAYDYGSSTDCAMLFSKTRLVVRQN